MGKHKPAIDANLAEIQNLNWTQTQRINKAKSDGTEASKLFSTAGVMAQIVVAIDTEDEIAFALACNKAGITNADLIRRMWDATMGSIDPQSARPCW